MSSNNVIVFGPTGAVGGAAAQEAVERGAHVWLAMRDTSKSLSWLTPEAEKTGSYTRVKADLSDPASIADAVKESGAKSVFIYALHGADGMKSTVQALKDAGITWVVLLSSFSIRGDIRKVEPRDAIPYVHAQVEINLQDIGIPFASLRPGYFSSNLFQFWLPSIKQGTLKLFQPDNLQDHIVPTNIGQVAGAMLVQPQPNLKPTEPQIVYLLGPQLIPQRDAAERLVKIVNKDAAVDVIDADEFLQGFAKAGYPPAFGDYMKRALTGEAPGSDYPEDLYEEGKNNVTKISGKKLITFDEYLESIKSELTA